MTDCKTDELTKAMADGRTPGLCLNEEVSQEQAVAELMAIDLPEPLSKARLESMLKFGRYLRVELVTRVSLATQFTAVEQAQECVRVGRDMAANLELEPGQRIAALRAVALGLKAIGELTAKAVELAERFERPIVTKAKTTHVTQVNTVVQFPPVAPNPKQLNAEPVPVINTQR